MEAEKSFASMVKKIIDNQRKNKNKTKKVYTCVICDAVVHHATLKKQQKKSMFKIIKIPKCKKHL